jgi:hypothetical protein
MSIKRAVLLFTLSLALPLVAWANSVDVSNSGGRITSNGTTLTLSGSTLVGVEGFGSRPLSGTLGYVTLTTGNLISGSLAAGGTFAAGGSFTLAGNGINGLSSGTLFSGTFTGPVTWTATWTPNMGPNHQGAWIYTLKGNVTGMLSSGTKVSGTIIETTFDVSNGRQFSTMANLNGGLANLSVPEPGTMALLATGLIGLAMLIRRKKTV